MAENTVSQNTSTVKENTLIHIDFLNENTPVVSSRDVALHFQKKHQHILREIERIRSQVPVIFFKSNFGQSFCEASTGNGAVRKFPVYHLTRDAFSLLVMGFTGKAAIQWKLRYIEAFNALEAAMRENIRTDALEIAARAVAEAHKEAKRHDKLATLEKALGYINKGLNITEAAKLVDVPARTLHGRLARLGLLPRPRARQEQASLLAGV